MKKYNAYLVTMMTLVIAILTVLISVTVVTAAGSESESKEVNYQSSLSNASGISSESQSTNIDSSVSGTNSVSYGEKNSIIRQTQPSALPKSVTDPLQMGSMVIGKSTLMYMVGPKQANDNKVIPNSDIYINVREGSFLVGRNNFNLQTANNAGKSERWLSIHGDSDTSDTKVKQILNGASQLLIGTSGDESVGGIIGPYENKVATQTGMSLSQDGILRENINYQYFIEGTVTTFTDVVQFVPTEWGTVIVKEHVTNTSGRDLKGVFFGRSIDTDMRPFASGVDGDYAIGDKVAIRFLGNQRGLYEDQNIPATTTASNDGIPAKYPGGSARLSYSFDMQDGTGPEAWTALYYSDVTMGGGAGFIGGYKGNAFKNTTTDLGMASVSGGVGDSGSAGSVAIQNVNTEIAMMWLSKDMPAGASRDLSYEVGFGGQGQYKLPEVTLDQSPQALFDGNNVQLTGTVTDADNEGKIEQLKYQVQHANGTIGTAKNLTTITNTKVGTANKYVGTADAVADSLAVGDRIIVWAVDADGNLSVNKEYTDLVAPAVTAAKKVKNITTNETKYANSTIESVKDEVGYQATIKVSGTATAALAKGAILKDVLDNDLTAKAGSAQINYYNASGTLLSTQKADFNAQGQLITNTDVPIGGYLVVTYTATVNSNNKDKIDNIISVTGEGLKNSASSNAATVNIKKTAVIDTLKQTIENITAKTSESKDETEGHIGDVIRYTFTAHVKADSGTTLKSFVLNTQENNNSHVTDSSGSLNVDSNQYNFQYQLKGTTTWADLDKSGLKEVTGGVRITLPDGQVALDNDDTITIRYSKSIKSAPIENKYLYNDGLIGNVGANSTRVKTLTNTKITVRYVDLDEDLTNPDTKPTQVADEIQVTGKIGSKLSEGTPTITGRVAPKIVSDYTVLWVTEDADLTSATWQAAYKDDPQFETTDRVITYGYKKAMLTIDAPKAWNFGTYNATQADNTYYLSGRGKTKSQVAVVDYYGVQSWHLKVQQNDQFKDTESHELTGAELRVTNGDVSTSKLNTAPGDITSKSQFSLTAGSNSPTEIMSFDRTGTYQSQNNDTSSVTSPYTDAGQGIWYYNFGTGKASEYSVGLHVPATTKRYETHYTTELTWLVTVAP